MIGQRQPFAPIAEPDQIRRESELTDKDRIDQAFFSSEGADQNPTVESHWVRPMNL